MPLHLASPRRHQLRALLGRLRWYELVPELVLLAGLTLFAVDEPDAAFSAFGSSRAVTLMALGAGAWVAARLITLAVLPSPGARGLIFAVAAVAALAVVVVPAYRNTTVVEAFPGPPTTVATPATTPSAPPAPVPGATTVTPPPVPTTGVTGTTPPTPSAPELLATAALAGIDHRASGRANIYRATDGSLVVGLEDIDIQPGPDYDVYVVPGVDRRDVDGGTRLDDLRGNIGTQFYVVDPRTEVVTGAWTVLVWCQRFGVPVAHATPIPP